VTTHRIDIAAGDDGKYACTYLGERIGEWRNPESAAAHWLLEAGHAGQDDVLTSYRGGMPANSAPIGWLARHAADARDTHAASATP
jgi:hypothetical protein